MELISREEAKRKITEELDSIDHVPSWVFERLSNAIESLPTVEERKEGKWVTEYNGNGWNDYWDYTCSVCGKKYERADVLCKANFCPNCGAKMKGE